MFRIRLKETKFGAPAVLLLHGITDSADSWIMHNEDQAPAFVLA